MKLFISPGACSLSPHLVAHELGIPLEIEKVDLKAKHTASGRDFLEINPKGYVPALELDNGEVLTEGPAIVQYLADQKPQAGLAPPNGTLARARLQEMLNFISTELHKTYSPLFNPATVQETRQERREHLRKRYAYVEKVLTKNRFLLGDQFTVADAYLFVVTNWAKHADVDLSEFKSLAAFQQRVAARPAVQAALVAEGLIKQQAA
jgi:glutathione S-transferase